MLNLQRTTVLLSGRGLAFVARVSRARKHSVLGSDPALAGVTQERRHRFFNRRGTQHAGVAALDQYGAFGVTGEVTGNAGRPQLIGSAAARSGFHAYPLLGWEGRRRLSSIT